MRTLSAGGITAVNAPHVVGMVAIEMELTAPLYLNTSSIDFLYSSKLYLGVGQVGRIGDIVEAPGQVKPLTFTINGAPQSNLALVQNENFQGRPVSLYFVLFDVSTFSVLDFRLRWQGVGDVMTSVTSEGSCVVEVSAENLAADLFRPSSRLYTDTDQQLFAGETDTFFKYTVDQEGKSITWPAASWGRV